MSRRFKPPEFTIAEHLAVQKKIEVRAYLLWQAAGCPLETAVSDWRQAEIDVLLEFCLEYRARHPALVHTVPPG